MAILDHPSISTMKSFSPGELRLVSAICFPKKARRLLPMGLSLAVFLWNPAVKGGERPVYSPDRVVSLAQENNRDIAIARARLGAAAGGIVEARSGYLPSVLSTGLYRKRETQESSRLRADDYNASLRVVQNVYTGGKTTHQLAIAQLLRQKQQLELETVVTRVTMDVRVACAELQLNRAKVGVREQSLGVLQRELKTQQERFTAGTVGELNVRRAEVALSNEEPELIDAKKQVQLSYLRLADLLGLEAGAAGNGHTFELSGELEYRPARVDLNGSLAQAVTNRPEVISRQNDIAIEVHQLAVDQSELRPQVDVFAGYEAYNERDPEVGKEFNHGYVVGVNATWKIFDGFATKGRMHATRARHAAAVQALESTKLLVESEVRSAVLDLQQADRVLAAETKNVETAAESLELARANVAEGLATQLDVLQAASDISRTKATRLNAIFLHNAAQARLAKACGTSPSAEFEKQVERMTNTDRREADLRMLQMARPPAKLKTAK